MEVGENLNESKEKSNDKNNQDNKNDTGNKNNNDGKAQKEKTGFEEFTDEFGYSILTLSMKYKHLNCPIFLNALKKNFYAGLGLSLTGPKNISSKKTFIFGIKKESAAANSELQVGDQILEVNGISFENIDYTCSAWIILMMKGLIFKIVSCRNSSLQVNLEILPKEIPIFNDITLYNDHAEEFTEYLHLIKDGRPIGLILNEVYDEYLGWITKVETVSQNSPASIAEFKPGHIITKINETATSKLSSEEINALIDSSDATVKITAIETESVRVLIEDLRKNEWSKRQRMMNLHSEVSSSSST